MEEMGGPVVKEGCPAQASSGRKWAPTQDVAQAPALAPADTTEENVPHRSSFYLRPPCSVVAPCRRMPGGGLAKVTRALMGDRPQGQQTHWKRSRAWCGGPRPHRARAGTWLGPPVMQDERTVCAEPPLPCSMHGRILMMNDGSVYN